MNRVLFAIAAAAAVSSAPLMAKGSELFPSFTGQRYITVRSKLIAVGYRPIRVSTRDLSDGCPGFSSCAAYPEVANCSGIGIALCESAFFNSRTGKYIKIISYGESDKLVASIYRAANFDLKDWGLVR